MIRTAVLIDGGNLRALTRQAGKTYNPDYVEKVVLACPVADEQIIRVLYYDCGPFNGRARLPISGNMHQFYGSDNWLRQLARKELFAVREGVLKFRGFRPRNIPLNPSSLTDHDFEPIFEQKGVDMRIGLDIALYSDRRAVDRLVLIVQDTDCIPAMKQARKSGLQIVLIELPNSTIAPELLEHCDFRRKINWP